MAQPSVPGAPVISFDGLTPKAVPAPGRLTNEKALAPFLRKLGHVPQTALNIVQIGDSHTAGDLFTGGWRNSWQLRYGPGGRGLLPVGRPNAAYVTMGVTARQSPGWTTNALLGSRYSSTAPALGLSGFTQTALRAGASASLAADSSAFNFDRFAFCGLTGPGMGSLKVKFAKSEQTFSLAAQQPGAACFEISSPELEASVSLETLEDKPVSLTSWSTRRSSGGVILSNLGVVSARLQHFVRTDDAVLAQELKLARPDLIVIAYGTNEGFFTDLRLDQEAQTLRSQIVRLRQLLGNDVPVLLIGPPDVTTSRPEMALPEMAQTVTCPSGRYVPGNVARMRDLQMRLATELNVGFWDWQGAMGGACSSAAWVAQGLQRGDHIHFNASGGMMLGRALAADLDDARARLVGK